MDSDITTLEVLRGVGEFKGSVVGRLHLANTALQLEDAARATSLIADTNTVTMSGSAGGTIVSATSTECALVDARATADDMFRKWAHEKYDCPGTPPDHAYWVL